MLRSRNIRRITCFFRIKPLLTALLACLPLLCGGCQSPLQQLQSADRAAKSIIEEKQLAALGRQEPFTIESPAVTLRRRLLQGQQLPYADPASLGTRYLAPPRHWPAEHTLAEVPQEIPPWLGGAPLSLTLFEALQVAARNSREYQAAKEAVFRSALALDLERDRFKNSLAGALESEFTTDRSGDQALTGSETSASGSVSRRLQTGADLLARIGIDLVKLLTLGGSSSLGLFADASIAIPLLRGSGRHIAAESLTQAERDTLYEIWSFERFKQTFAVDIASEYLLVLQQMDQVQNAEEHYRSLIASARRARRLADAGRLPRIQVGQALQDELSARERWIRDRQTYQRALDRFKASLGLPPDGLIELDGAEMIRLVAHRGRNLVALSGSRDQGERAPAADEPILLEEISMDQAGPYELEQTLAMRLGLQRRLDLRIAMGRVADTQRAVVVAADALRAELTLLGRSSVGESRSLATAGAPDAGLDPTKGFYSALLSLDLPFERTAERNAFRESYIALERRVRDLQGLEDQIKLGVRNGLRDLLKFREDVQIQTQSIEVAQQRVKGAELLLRAGRAEIRDLLEAREDLVAARNALSSARVNYRVAELALQRDMGVLKVDGAGLWQEYRSEESSNAGI